LSTSFSDNENDKNENGKGRNMRLNSLFQSMSRDSSDDFEERPMGMVAPTRQFRSMDSMMMQDEEDDSSQGSGDDDEEDDEDEDDDEGGEAGDNYEELGSGRSSSKEVRGGGGGGGGDFTSISTRLDRIERLLLKLAGEKGLAIELDYDKEETARLVTGTSIDIHHTDYFPQSPRRPPPTSSSSSSSSSNSTTNSILKNISVEVQDLKVATTHNANASVLAPPTPPREIPSSSSQSNGGRTVVSSPNSATNPLRLFSWSDSGSASPSNSRIVGPLPTNVTNNAAPNIAASTEVQQSHQLQQPSTNPTAILFASQDGYEQTL
jgi:hypothetical protein